jgi:hypothetical protein
MNICGRNIKVQGRLVRVGRIQGDKYKFMDDPQPVIEGLRASRNRVDLFTFLQRLPDTTPKFDYPFEMDNLAVVRVTTFDDWWNNQIRSYPRNRARQAEKRGVTLREVPFDGELVKGIWEVYNESRIRQGVPFTHYGKDLETVHREEATYLDSSIFIGAFLGEKLIGFVKLVMDETGTQANLMNIVAMAKYKETAPTNALIARAVRSCADRGISFLVYQNFAYGNKQGDSLSHFKAVNGFQRVDIPRYYVPLTPLGELAWRLKLHHRWSDRLPESVGRNLRRVRSAWYTARFGAEAGSQTTDRPAKNDGQQGGNEQVESNQVKVASR